jgi:hypothetical protein
MSQTLVLRCDFRIADKRKYRTCGQEVPGNVPTVFSLGEVAHRADLCAEHQLRLQESLAPFVAIAEVGYAPVGKAVRKLLDANGGKATSADLRVWARENGYHVADTGAIRKEVKDAYKLAKANV